MRILLAIGVLGLAGCDMGPPGYNLRGLCDSRLQLATEVAASPLVVTDDEEGTLAAQPQILGLDMQPSDFVSVATDASSVTVTANRVDTGYLKLVMGKSRQFDATFVIQVTTEAVRTDPYCATSAVEVRER